MSDESQSPENPKGQEFVTVLRTSSVTAIPVLKSVLEGAEIPYVTEGEVMMNLFPSQALGPLFSKSAPEMRFKVPADRAEEARQLLTPIEMEGEAELPEGSLPPEE